MSRPSLTERFALPGLFIEQVPNRLQLFSAIPSGRILALNHVRLKPSVSAVGLVQPQPTPSFLEVVKLILFL